MFIADYHMHTNFSSDSDAPMEDMILKAVSLGLREIAITDHVDFDYPDPEFPFLVDFSEYVPAILKYREKYADKIKILLGVELGLQPHVKDKIAGLMSENSFDFVIGSTHCADREDLCAPYFFRGKTKHEARERYFENVLEGVKLFDKINVYGHLDFINRYGGYPDKTLKYSQHMEIIDNILKELIARGKGIEINTSGYAYGVGGPHPGFEIVQRYRKLGGEILTIGSDAHSPEYIGNRFKDAYEMAREAGFNALTLFRGQKPLWTDI